MAISTLASELEAAGADIVDLAHEQYHPVRDAVARLAENGSL